MVVDVDHKLPNGAELEIRAIRADDKRLLAAGFALLSDKTRQRRFLTAKPRLSSRELRYLTEIDGHDHVALVAVERERPTHIAAVARFVRDRERPDTAEFAIVVGDAYQRMGLGTKLAELLIDEAKAHGVGRFTATTLSDNAAVQKLIAAIARHLDYVQNGDGTRVLSADLAA
jgi:RimJ/RimL family protein N-acetyltransferase